MPDDINEQILMRSIRDLRTALGLTQTQFAIELGKSHPTVQRYEGVRPPRGFDLVPFLRLARDLGRGDLVEVFATAILRSIPKEASNLITEMMTIPGPMYEDIEHIGAADPEYRPTYINTEEHSVVAPIIELIRKHDPRISAVISIISRNEPLSLEEIYAIKDYVASGSPQKTLGTSRQKSDETASKFGGTPDSSGGIASTAEAVETDDTLKRLSAGLLSAIAAVPSATQPELIRALRHVVMAFKLQADAERSVLGTDTHDAATGIGTDSGTDIVHELQAEAEQLRRDREVLAERLDAIRRDREELAKRLDALEGTPKPRDGGKGKGAKKTA